jgi:serine phosphatase RsbU (regulator of sigma subunit)/PAS domain-containing protein/anti-sigma regulatory factor (Ser/Thr protein kinase)
MAAGELADGAAPLEEVVERTLDLVVPALADLCVVHWEGNGSPRLAGVRVDGPDGPAVEARIRERAAELPGAAGHEAPALVADADAAPGLPLLQGAGAGSAAVVPLRRSGRITGELLLAARRGGRQYAPDDLRFLQVLGGRLAVALDNVGLVATDRQAEALVSGMEDAVVVRDPDGRILLANHAAVELAGAGSLADLRALPLEALLERFSIYGADGRPLGRDDVGWVRALEGRRAAAPMLVRRVDNRTGEQRWLSSKASLVLDNRGRTTMVVSVTEDVTAAKRSEIGQRLLVEAGRMLSSTTDFAATLQQIAELTVPTLADWCTIDVPAAGGRLEQVAVAHLDPTKVELAHRLRARHPVRVDDDGAVGGVIRTGEPVVMSDLAPAALREAAHDGEDLELLEGLGLSALLIVPLHSGDEVLGALTLVASQPHRRFDDADLEVAGALARRVGDALRNDQLFRDRVEMTHVLSVGLRPEASPVLPGCDVAAVYHPAGEDVAAGGDFYEVIDAPSGSIVVMGDVVGKGAPAAALSALSRVTLRTAGRLTGNPRAALDELNHMLRRRGGMSLCTVVAVALPSELPGTASVLLAGHPPPLLLHDGVAKPLGRHGPMLGAVEVADWPADEVVLAPLDVLVLYTDGVLDTVLPDGDRFGEARLRALVEDAGGDVDAIARAFEAELGGLRLRDDVALMAIRCPGPPALLARGTLDGEAEPVLELTLSGGPTAPGRARHALSAAAGARLSTRGLADALIIVSELATNAIRHGGARTDADELTVHAALLPGGLRIEVSDHGPGFEPGGHGPRPDGGYGLQLLDRLATRWGVAGAEPVTVWVELDR